MVMEMDKGLKDCLNYWKRISGIDKYIYYGLLAVLVVIFPGNLFLTVLGIYVLCSGSMELFAKGVRYGGMQLSISLPFSRKDLWNTHALVETAGLGIFAVLSCVRGSDSPAAILALLFVLVFAHMVCAVLPLNNEFFLLAGVPCITLWGVDFTGSFSNNMKIIFGGVEERMEFLILLGMMDLAVIIFDIWLWNREKKKFVPS